MGDLDLVELAQVALIAVVAYCWIILVLRVSGNIALTKMNAFSFAGTVAFGSMLAMIVLAPDIGVVRGMVALATLALLQWLFAKLSRNFRWFDSLVRSEPCLLLENGELRDEAMKEESISRAEIEAAVRAKGLARFDQVAAVVLETDGSFSVIARQEGEVELLENVSRD